MTLNQLKDTELTITSFLSSYDARDFVARMKIEPATKSAYTYHYRIDKLLSQAEQFCQGNDIYMSVNPIRFVDHKIRRCKENVGSLLFCYADLDCYKLGFSKEQTLMRLYEDYFHRSIPFPSFIIDSGRGLYLLWKVNENVKAYKRWLKVQKYLHETLMDVGSDPAVVSDSARVFRVISSVNSKSNSPVRIIDGCKDKYTLYSIMRDFMPDEYKKHVIPISEKQKKTTPKTKQKRQIVHAGNGSADIINMPSPTPVLSARLIDLETLLINFRDKEGAGRENILFLYRYFSLCLTKDKEDSLNITRKLNNKLKNPIPSRELEKATMSAEKAFDEGMKYRYSNAKLCEFLGITDKDEDILKCMKSIITKKERYNRRSARNRAYYLQSLKEKGQLTKKESSMLRMKEFMQCLADGLSREEICKKLSISKSLFYQLKKELSSISEEVLAKTENTAPENEKKSDNSNVFLFEPESPEFSALVLKEYSSAIQCPHTDLDRYSIENTSVWFGAGTGTWGAVSRADVPFNQVTGAGESPYAPLLPFHGIPTAGRTAPISCGDYEREKQVGVVFARRDAGKQINAQKVNKKGSKDGSKNAMQDKCTELDFPEDCKKETDIPP